jgi:hypothetical protein
MDEVGGCIEEKMAEDRMAPNCMKIKIIIINAQQRVILDVISHHC